MWEYVYLSHPCNGLAVYGSTASCRRSTRRPGMLTKEVALFQVLGVLSAIRKFGLRPPRAPRLYGLYFLCPARYKGR